MNFPQAFSDVPRLRDMDRKAPLGRLAPAADG